MSEDKDKYVVLHIEGGLGKNVAGSAIVKPLSEKYQDRKLIVCCSWPEIFYHNPNIYRVYSLGSPYFYDNYIKDKDTIVLRREPYFESTHIMQKTPLMQTWFSMYGLKFDESKHKPHIELNMYGQQSHHRWQVPDKKILVLQTNGGPLFEDQQQNVYSWARDMPFSVADTVAQEAFKKGYHVFQVCRPNSPQINGAEIVNQQMSNIELFGILKAANKRLLIDSCLQHAAAAYNLPSTVLWIGTHPEMFGYKLHNNITCNKPAGVSHLLNSMYFDYDLASHPHECPFKNETEIFNVNKIINSLKL